MKIKTKKSKKLVFTKYLVVFFILISGSNIYAQSLTGGITAGVSTGSVKISDIPTGFANVIKGNNILGFNAGVFAKLDLYPFYIKPQLLVNYRHGTLDIYETDESTEQKDFSINKLEVPLLFGFKIIGPLCVEAGPVYNYILSSTNDFNGSDVVLKKSGLGYRAGAAADFGKLNLFVHYQGITNRSSNSSETSTFQSPYEVIFGIGIDLGKSK